MFRQFLSIVSVVVGVATVTGCAGQGAESTEEGTGAATANPTTRPKTPKPDAITSASANDQAITHANWASHPKIQRVRDAVAEIARMGLTENTSCDGTMT
jgi:hypothetical protein